MDQDVPTAFYLLLLSIGPFAHYPTTISTAYEVPRLRVCLLFWSLWIPVVTAVLFLWSRTTP